MDSGFATDLKAHDVVYDGRVVSDFLTKFLSWLLPIALLIRFWWFLIHRVAGPTRAATR